MAISAFNFFSKSLLKRNKKIQLETTKVINQTKFDAALVWNVAVKKLLFMTQHFDTPI